MIRTKLISAAVSIVVSAAPAFAQDASNTAQPTVPSSGYSNSGVGMDTNGRSDAGVPAGLTRAEVKQDLIRSERNGQLAALNATVYQGGR